MKFSHYVLKMTCQCRKLKCQINECHFSEINMVAKKIWSDSEMSVI